MTKVAADYGVTGTVLKKSHLENTTSEDAARVSSMATWILGDERSAYYAVQCLAARSRAAGDMPEFRHWAKVASEVVHLSPNAEMDLHVVRAIADEERARARP